MATNKNYVEQMNNKYAKQLKGLLDEMPDFCVEYFDSLEFNKQARTKIAYALDIKGFFKYLIDDTKKFANYDIKLKGWEELATNAEGNGKPTRRV